MQLTASLEQAMLRDSARAFLEAEAGFAQRQARVATGRPPDREQWLRLAEMGWLGLGIPEEAGGFGGGAVEQSIVAEACGRSLLTDPFIGCAVLAPRVVLASGCAASHADLLAGVADGTHQLALAWQEAAGRYARLPGTVVAKRTAQGYVLSGCKMLVLGGATCDQLIVSACLETAGGACVLLVCDAGAPGVQRQPYALMDNQWAADVVFDQVTLPASALLAGPDTAADALDEALDHASVALCALLVGGVDRAIELAVSYMGERRQFGQALSGFQVQQHRTAQMFIDADAGRSMVLAGLAALAAPPVLRRRAVSAAKHKVTEVAKAVTGEAIHQHGGMGMTLEYPVGHHLRTAMVADKLFGDADFHLQRYRALEGAAGELASRHWEWA